MGRFDGDRAGRGALTVAGQWRSFTAFPSILAIAVVNCAAQESSSPIVMEAFSMTSTFIAGAKPRSQKDSPPSNAGRGPNPIHGKAARSRRRIAACAQSGVVTPGRLELPTRSLGNCCSIHLSYGATFRINTLPLEINMLRPQPVTESWTGCVPYWVERAARNDVDEITLPIG